MSETDDTDVLCLIPPDFFLVRSSESEESLLDSSRTVVQKPPSCTAQVLHKLVNQVHSLESRLESLEISTTSDLSTIDTKSKRSESTGSVSIESKFSTFPRRKRRKTKKRYQDLSLASIDSSSTITFSKTVPPLKLHTDKPEAQFKTLNVSSTMDGDLSSIGSTPSKKNDKLLLHEIDEFLTKVEAYESPDSKYLKEDLTGSENVIKAAGEYLSSKLENRNPADVIKLPSGKIVSSTVLDKYIYLVKSNPESTKTDQAVPLVSSSKYCETQASSQDVTPEQIKTSKELPAKSPSIRRLNFTADSDVRPTSTPKRTHSSSYLETFQPSSNKIYERASKVVEQFKNQTTSRYKDSYLTSPKKEEFKMPQMRPYVPDRRDGFKIAALQNKMMDSIDTDLLSLSELWGEKGEKVDRVDSSKLEEERLKREHCESMIQQLQKKLLEQQEKLAVALKVDKAKDTAIAKLKEAWIKVTNSLEKSEDRHNANLDKMNREVEHFKMAADDAQKKASHFETELYKALDLAHDYQDKCKLLMSEKAQLKEAMEKVLSDKDGAVQMKEKEIEVLKENYETVMRLNKQSTDCVKNLEDVLEKEKADHDETKSMVNELNRKIKSLLEENTLVQQEKSLLKSKVNEERARGDLVEKQLCEKQNQCSELLKKCDTLDNEVKTLRKHLELQKTELKVHYQKQLEDAVLNKLQEFQQQLDHAQREMEIEAREKENAIVDTYNKQIARIEDQHKLEINVLEEKQKEEINLYRLQLAQASEKIGLMENKLETYRRRRTQIASQLHSVMESQWRQALLILTNPTANLSSLDITRADSVATPVAHDYAPPKIPPLTMPPFAERGLQRDHDRSTDKVFNFEGLSDNELQHYVKTLLTKPPNFDGSGDSTNPAELSHPNEEPTSDRPDKQERKDKPARRSMNPIKPPWKA